MYWDVEDVKSFMKAFNYECTSQTSIHLYQQMDTKGIGRIEFDDFIEFMTETKPIKEKEGKLRDIFFSFSQNKEFMVKEDMIRICRDHAINITEENALLLFRKIGSSEDPDKISFPIFEKLVQHSSGDRMITF